MDPRIIDLFWKYVKKTKDHWVWVGFITDTGHGQLRIKRSWCNRCFRAHRISWEIHFGPIPAGFQVNHKPDCHNPACVNPDHLYLGTQRENMGDRQSAGNYARLGDHPNSRLTDSDWDEIKRLYLTGEYSQRELAKRYGYSPRGFSKFLHGLKPTNG